MKWWKIIFFSGMAVMPLVFWPWGRVVYEVPRVWFVLRWIEVLAVIAIWGAWSRGIKRKRGIREEEEKFGTMDGPLLWLLIGFCAWALFTSVIGADPAKSILGNFYRRDGLITLFHLVGFSFLVSMVWKSSWRYYLVRAIGWGTIAVCIHTVVLGIAYWVLGDRSVMVWDGEATLSVAGLTLSGRAIGGLFGNPNFLAGYLAVVTTFVFYWVTSGRAGLQHGPTKFTSSWPSPARRGNMLLFPGIFILLFLTLLLTQARSGVICFFLAPAVYIFLIGNRMCRVIAASVVLIVIIMGGYVLRSDRQLGFVAEGRERIIRRTLFGVAKRPLTGYGWANADYAFESVAWPIILEHDVYVDKAHGTVLEVLATTGIVGLMVYVGALVRLGYVLIRRFWSDGKGRVWQATLLTVLIVYCVHAQTNIISIAEEVMFFLVVGIAGQGDPPSLPLWRGKSGGD